MAESAYPDEKTELRQDAHQLTVASSSNADSATSAHSSTQPSSRATPVSVFTVDDVEPNTQPPPYSAEARSEPPISPNNLSHPGYVYTGEHNNLQSIDTHGSGRNAISPFTNGTSPPQHDLPIVIPQVAAGPTMPFMRAYAPTLAHRGIEELDFITFLDGLNLAATHNKFFTAMDLTGNFIRSIMFPLPITLIVGNAISASAKYGTSESNKQKIIAYLASSNEKFFNPRGLRVCICTATELRPRIGFPEHARMVLPFQNFTELTYQPSVPQRRMLALQNYVAETRETSMRRPRREGTLVKKQSKRVDRDVRQTEKKMERTRKRAEKSGEYDLTVSKEEKEAEKLLYVLVEVVRS